MNDLTPKNNDKDSVDYLKDTFQTLTEFLTGFASADKKDWALSIGYLLQRVRGGNFMDQLIQEVQKYKENGKIKEDYLKTEQSITCLQEILDFIDKDSPDNIRFEAIKDLYLTICAETLSNRDDILPHQLLRICRKLSSAELSILFATYDVTLNENWKEEETKNMQSRGCGLVRDWIKYMISKSGLKFQELVVLNEESLIQQKLLTRRDAPEGSGFIYSEYYRLTSLGYHLCQFIKNIKR